MGTGPTTLTELPVTKPSNSHRLILVSIVFAVAILISSRLLAGTGYGTTVTFLLIAAWWIPFSMLTAAEGGTTIRGELRCLKRRLLGR